MRKASLGTLFLTVFLDLLGFGLVIPFLPGVARHLGASDFVATLPAVAYSLMQFLFIPIWGRLSDRVGRRPVLLWSIAATAGGMALLGVAQSLALLSGPLSAESDKIGIKGSVVQRSFLGEPSASFSRYEKPGCGSDFGSRRS